MADIDTLPESFNISDCLQVISLLSLDGLISFNCNPRYVGTTPTNFSEFLAFLAAIIIVSFPRRSRKYELKLN